MGETRRKQLRRLYEEAEDNPSLYATADTLKADINEDIATAAEAAVDRLFDFVAESGEHLTCGEFNSFIDLMRALDRDPSDLLTGSAHVMHDEEEDEHYVRGEVVGECERCGEDVLSTDDYLTGEAAPKGAIQHERCYDDDEED